MNAVPDQSELQSLRRVALVAGVVGIGLCAVCFMTEREQLARSFLTAWLYWLGLSLGSLALLMLHNLTGGDWGKATRRLFVSGAVTVPYMALMFVPIALSIKGLYPWADLELVSHDKILQFKKPYLNADFFFVRAIFYFAVWSFLAWYVVRRVRITLANPTPEMEAKLRLLSGRGLLIYALTITFAAIDWGMSLEPHWFSTIYGLIYLTGQGLSGVAFGTMATIFLARKRLAEKPLTSKQLNDLGNLMLAFTMLWAYMSFSQFLIIWYANLPEEVVWYLRRTEGGWLFVAIALAVLQFGAPFFALLSRRIKRNPINLAKVALWILLMHWVEVIWLIEPAFNREGTFIPWIDLLATLGIGGIWLALFTLRAEQVQWLPSDHTASLEGGH